ncbi:MAG: hypothetical protein KJO08_05205 [Gammaproteobacteria bacterium]|nr:hypothetical protein [Gammaproteobacteria bacterium]NNJ84759.1 hypothetical protein [Gammaproteobacteria bacterium]
MNRAESFSESGMNFGPFQEGYCFPIERSEIYRGIGPGVKVAEFLLLRTSAEKKPPVIWVVEAKSSTPRPETQPNFDEFIDEIRLKLTNAMSLWLAARLGRHSQAELSEPFKRVEPDNMDFRLVLVVNHHPDRWLKPLQEALVRALHPVVKTWALSPTAVKVINGAIARDLMLIQ